MNDTSLPLSQRRQVEAICTAFETAWHTGQHPVVEDCLREAPAEWRALLLPELLVLDLQYRRRLGEQPTAAEYRARFPEDATFIDDAFLRVARGATGSEAVTDVPPTRGDSTDSPTRPVTPAADASASWPSISGYEILAEVNSGGMGTVYKARQLAARRVVALKTISEAALARPEYRSRFRIEVEAAARLSHPNVIQIYDVGEQAGVPFFTMEFAESGSLADRLAAGPLGIREAAAMTQTLAEAIHYAHGRDVLHRDLKPGNVMLRADGRPLITDFGLAKLLDHRTQVTLSRAVLGTAAYMAPEQAQGKKPVGPAPDVYGLGAILYELLTGQPPFMGSLEAIIRKVVEDDPEAPSRLRDDVPAELEAICLHCLEKDPKDRYPTAQALANDLACWLRGEATSVVPITELDRQARWARKAGFEVEDVLTYGVHDIVSRARRVHLNRLVALKVFTAPVEAEEAGREDLQTEARTAASLDHPNIVRIHSSAHSYGRIFLEFEYIAGGNLIERYKDQPAPPREAAELVRQLADAVHHAHQQGILHCRLKPGSVLVTADGVAKIANFGLGMPADGSFNEQRSPYRRLPSYMSPEVAEGRQGDVGPASDVYALGAILYKLLTGGPPFLGETVEETLDQVLHKPPRRPTEVRPDIVRTLEGVCLKCLEKRPERRYASAAELRDALGAFLFVDSAARAPAPVIDLGMPSFEVLRELGRGSMSIVYEARQRPSGRIVALKAFHKDFHFGDKVRSRLRQVCQRLDELGHPNIVEIYEFGEHEERPYIGMEMLPDSLERRPAGSAMTPSQVAVLVATLARAVHAVHQIGITHGNLKPSKVLFTADNVPKIAGFLVFQDGTTPTEEYASQTIQAPAVMGTPRYMAPEQLEGVTGPGADIHALGLILYELLTGWHPYRAATLWAMMRQVLEHHPEPPSKLRLDLPRDIETICLRCLEKKPSNRYSCAAELADALDLFLAGKPPPDNVL